LLRLSGLGARRPRQLSGGQQQRVALGRALVYDPEIILMDEPLGALDRTLRIEMEREIRALQHELGATVVYVTHDQQEAYALSDTIAVMHDGAIVGVGSPAELYANPPNAFVASFFGGSNPLPVEAAESVPVSAEAAGGDRSRETRAFGAGRFGDASAASVSPIGPRFGQLHERAAERFPGGASRTTLYVDPHPPYAARGEGWRLIDTDGRELIDFHGDFSALVHGHAFPPVVAAATRALAAGSAFGLPTAAEIELAEQLAARVEWAPRWRFTNSGTEAVMAAVRAARAATGRDVVVRFAGCWHGSWDALAQPNAAAGVPAGVREAVVSVPLGDSEGLVAALDRHAGRVACVLLDLMPYRAGLRPVERGFAQLVREQTAARGIVLIVDEVITFRMSPGGAGRLWGIEGDIVTLGKLIGGGLPIGALGGRPEPMDVFDPRRPGSVEIAGTFSANPVSTRAGLAALQALDAGAIAHIDALGERLRGGLAELGYTVTGRGSLLKLHAEEPPALWWRLYREGVLIAPSGLACISTPMDGAAIDRALAAFARALRA
ncbi:MAG TPA: aminotransferase class III-fold pyridoxal phosphate-dependent enzyme, partial [Solirubrobacteraceae bacterium]|nr:aminotransferase class III-fold pyridoxal phosphate-dependent enzyme [Solirubrobacteraceae bacterium]